VVLLGLTGACSTGGSDDAPTSSEAASGAVGDAGDVPAPARAAERSAPDASLSYFAGEAEAAGAADTGGAAPREAAPAAAPVDGRSLIKQGNVALRSDDVPTARFDVGKVLDAHRGEVAEESTQADEDGDIERVRLVARVPVDEFEATVADLQDVAELIDVSTSEEDVSTEVIDTEVRVALQRRSIDRISVLLDSAADLRDIVTIERELSRREAELGSLEKRQAFLADQTTMATITLSIEPPREEREEAAPEEDDDGFLAGLAGGWDALKDVTTGLLTVGGAVLPFALVLLVLAVPARVLLRRYAPRSSADTAPAAGPPPATA
jgi:hypothetical protein